MTPPTSHPSTSLIGGLLQKLDSAFSELVGGRQVALLDFPNHPNCGDSAIYRGELAALQRCGATIVHQADTESFDVDEVRGLASDVVLLIHGGGNFGDLYPAQERLRLETIRRFPERRVIQLPQSIHYSSDRPLAEMRKAVSDARHLTMILRDRQSHDFARSHFDCELRLLPDAAFALGSLTRKGSAVTPVEALVRSDTEATSTEFREAVARSGLPMEDWMEPTPTYVRGVPLSNLHHRLRRLGGPGRFIDRWERGRGRVYDSLSRAHTERGLRTLAQGRVVLTDRLHALILAELQGIPVAAHDSGYGKISSFWTTWLGKSALSKVYSDPREAVEAAIALGTDG